MDQSNGGTGPASSQTDNVDAGETKSPLNLEDTLVVFDWDDTILPTSWLERSRALAAVVPLRPEVQRQLCNLAAVCAQTLTLAEALGTVVIITNSAPGWLDQSCMLFLPQLVQKVRGYKVFAKPMQSPPSFKVSTFQRECRSYKNVISLGDGDSERAASLRLQATPIDKTQIGQKPSDLARHVKSVKLVDVPTCQQLMAEHEMLQSRLPDIAAYPGHLDLKARLPLASSGAHGTASFSGCSLVHFTKPATRSTTPAWSGPSAALPLATVEDLRSIGAIQSQRSASPPSTASRVVQNSSQILPALAPTGSAHDTTMPVPSYMACEAARQGSTENGSETHSRAVTANGGRTASRGPPGVFVMPQPGPQEDRGSQPAASAAPEAQTPWSKVAVGGATSKMSYAASSKRRPGHSVSRHVWREPREAGSMAPRFS
mmetsp:Transcript_32019/g.73112  ORF Transcript_32019/g.73112 Transcript_32019/m.73112 type:complete len:430 (-) Transcript_32019:115-1404(-)